jgi:hypothetical protein
MGGGASFPLPDKKLQEACKKGDLEAAKAAVEEGAGINSASPQPPLICAAWWGHANVIEFLCSLEEIDKDVRHSM